MSDVSPARITAICGSLQQQSSNLALVDAAVALGSSATGYTVTRYDGLRHIPPFDPDVQAAGNPPVVTELIDALTASDALVIACPEYAHSLPGTLKNALDWLVGSHYLNQLPLAVTASVAHDSRGRMGLAALAHIAGVLGADVVWERTIVRGPEADHDLGEMLDQLAVAGVARRAARESEEP